MLCSICTVCTDIDSRKKKQQECSVICGPCVQGISFLMKCRGAYYGLEMIPINSTRTCCNFFDRRVSASGVVIFQLQALLADITCAVDCTVHDQWLVSTTRSWKPKKLFKFVGYTSIAMAIYTERCTCVETVGSYTLVQELCAYWCTPPLG
jgi:hypothetical protein